MDLSSGHPDYSVWAGEQRVGRIYQQHSLAREQWFWGLNTVTLDFTVGVPTHGNADSFDDAKIRFRFAFDHWLEWALAMPRGDMKYPRVSAELKKMADGELPNTVISGARRKRSSKRAYPCVDRARL